MLELVLCLPQLSNLHLFLLELLVPGDPALQLHLVRLQTLLLVDGAGLIVCRQALLELYPQHLVLSRSVNTRSTRWWPCEAAITGLGLVLAAPRSSRTRTTPARPISRMLPVVRVPVDVGAARHVGLELRHAVPQLDQVEEDVLEGAGGPRRAEPHGVEVRQLLSGPQEAP